MLSLARAPLGTLFRVDELSYFHAFFAPVLNKMVSCVTSGFSSKTQPNGTAYGINRINFQKGHGGRATSPPVSLQHVRVLSSFTPMVTALRRTLSILNEKFCGPFFSSLYRGTSLFWTKRNDTRPIRCFGHIVVWITRKYRQRRISWCRFVDSKRSFSVMSKDEDCLL